MFNTITEIKAANALAGHAFFQPRTMRFFNSRVHDRLYPRADGGACFVTSEKLGTSFRRYTVRIAKPTGECETDHETAFQAFRTARAAHARAAELATRG